MFFCCYKTITLISDSWTLQTQITGGERNKTWEYVCTHVSWCRTSVQFGRPWELTNANRVHPSATWFRRYLKREAPSKKCTEPDEDSGFWDTGPCRLVNIQRRFEGRAKQSKKIYIFNNTDVITSYLATTWRVYGWVPCTVWCSKQFIPQLTLLVAIHFSRSNKPFLNKTIQSVVASLKSSKNKWVVCKAIYTSLYVKRKSVAGILTSLRASQSRVRISARANIYLFSKACRPTLGSTQLGSFLRVKTVESWISPLPSILRRG